MGIRGRVVYSDLSLGGSHKRKLTISRSKGTAIFGYMELNNSSAQKPYVGWFDAVTRIFTGLDLFSGRVVGERSE